MQRERGRIEELGGRKRKIERAAATCQSINKMQIFASFLALFCVAFATCHCHMCVATLRAAAAAAIAAVAFELQSSA